MSAFGGGVGAGAGGGGFLSALLKGIGTRAGTPMAGGMQGATQGSGLSGLLTRGDMGSMDQEEDEAMAVPSYGGRYNRFL